MPEAVNSNSIPVSGGQPDLFLLSTDLDQAHLMLGSLAESACLALKADDLPAHYSAGLSELFQQALRKIEDTSRKMVQLAQEQDRLKEAISTDSGPIWVDFMDKVNGVVCDVLRESGRHMPDDNATEWSDQDRTDYFQWSADLYNTIIRKMAGVRDPFEAGRWLVWAKNTMWGKLHDSAVTGTETDERTRMFKVLSSFLEAELNDRCAEMDALKAMAILKGATESAVSNTKVPEDQRFELGRFIILNHLNEDGSLKANRSLMRDQFIYDSHRKGFDASEISQVLNIKRKAVERAIARLTAPKQPEASEQEKRAG